MSDNRLAELFFEYEKVKTNSIIIPKLVKSKIPDHIDDYETKRRIMQKLELKKIREQKRSSNAIYQFNSPAFEKKDPGMLFRRAMTQKIKMNNMGETSEDDNMTPRRTNVNHLKRKNSILSNSIPDSNSQHSSPNLFNMASKRSKCKISII